MNAEKLELEMAIQDAPKSLRAELKRLKDEVMLYEEVEAALEGLVDVCNKDLVFSTYTETIRAEAALERLYRARIAKEK